MVSSVCEEPARSEVELLSLCLLMGWGGWATPWRAASFPTVCWPTLLETCPRWTPEPHGAVAVTRGQASFLFGLCFCPALLPMGQRLEVPRVLLPVSLGTGMLLHH